MNVEIFYCGVWNYLPEASRLEEELKGNFSDINIKLNEGSGGIFKVIIDDTVIFDKLDVEYRFPNDGEIIERIDKL